ncbi:catecholate siderophore receptor Fiu [Marilutibacter maris]|uniref:Catecholate siderophore receptor Fiu n=1 Tax=Marilutibacter maris TaxID=1605891 RepID=A0A2U9T2A5_9GAMM|nr:catecholate siderophore receptor Fiu [Lysobacter maris]AWV06593.1 catecholate siderophore receptor Fiu [Lysobacter maris]
MNHIKSRKHPIRSSRPQDSAAGRHLGVATLATSLALAAPIAAHAATAGDAGMGAADATTLDEVQVHGHRVKRYGADTVSSPKFTQPLLDTTQTIDVIGSDLFNEQGATSLTEALRNSPGVGTFYVGENGNTTTGDAIYMRGFDTSGSIFVDGVRDLGSITRDVFNIEQIEVTKGPAGTDTGRSSPTGSVNLVTKRPFLGDSTHTSLSIGTDSQTRATADWNQTFGSGNAFRINLMAQDSDVPGRDTIEQNRWGLATSLGFGLDGNTRVYVDLMHVQQDNLPDGGVPTVGLPGYSSPDPTRPEIGQAPRVDSSNFYGTLSDFDDVTADMLTLAVEHQFDNDMVLRNTTRWGRSHQEYMLTAFMVRDVNITTPDLADPSGWTITRNLPTFKDQRYTIATNQTSLTGSFRTGAVEHDFSTGIELIREEVDNDGIGALDGTTWPDADLYDPSPNVGGLRWGRTGADSDGRTDTVAVYFFDTLKFGERWQLNGGLRFDRYDTEFSSLAACGTRRGPDCDGQPTGTVLPHVNAKTSDTLFNWKVGALFKPTADSSLYANYAISQQPPGGSNLELSASANNANNPVFDPQEARTGEIGAKWNLADDNLMITAALYDTRIENEIVQDPVDQQYYQNGEKRVRGIEISAVGQITEAWSVSAGFTTMDTEVVEGPPVTSNGSRDLAYTPDRAFTAWTSYQFASGLMLGGGARYNGGLTRGADGAIGTPTHTDDYWVFDAVASYRFSEQWDVRLNVYNLFDEEYVAAINKSGYRYTPGQPRSALLTVNYRF